MRSPRDVLLVFGFLFFQHHVKTTHALMPPIPTGWEAVQPDGNTTIRLFYSGHEVGQPYMTNTYGHPIVVDQDGWYVYGRSHRQGSNTTQETVLRPTNLRVGLDEAPSMTESEKTAHLDDSKNGLVSYDELEDFNNTYHEHDQHGRSLSPTAGRPVCLVALIRFEDQVNRPMPPKKDYEVLFNSLNQGSPNGIVKAGSVREAFRFNSFQKMDMQFDIIDWTNIPGTEAQWSFGRNGLVTYFAKAAYPVLEAMDAKGTDWSRYDIDGDGEMDCFVVMHSGYSAEAGGVDCFNNRPPGKKRIWSHAPGIGEQHRWHSTDKSISLTKYAATSGVWGSCGNQISRVGASAHEIGHLYKIPDLTGRKGQGRGPGYFDMMGMPWGFDLSQNYPNLMGAWSRVEVGWVKPIELKDPGAYTVRPSQLFPDIYKITHGFPDGEYLLIEYRPKMFFDIKIPGNSGLLIWHIDEKNYQRADGNNGHPWQFGWPGNGNHHKVALLQADGRYDLEQEKNNGDAGDAWGPGMELGPGPAERDATSKGIYPNTNSYQGGVISRTGNRIYNIRVQGNNMRFSYSKETTNTLGGTLGGRKRLRKRRLDGDNAES